jgi:hypothetical protein
VNGAGREWTVICNRQRSQMQSLTISFGTEIVGEDAASLNEVFIAHANA